MSQVTTNDDPVPVGLGASEAHAPVGVEVREGATNLLGERLTPRARLNSVDAVRGIVMVVMALDHVRDFFHVYAKSLDPLDPAQTWTGLFFTRWITHFCAPAFVFLAGTGAFLSTRRGRSKKGLSWFLLTRGLWLILLELTLVRFGLTFNFDYHLVFAQVIWAIGWGLVVLAGLVFLPTRVIGAFGLALIFLHNLLDGFKAEGFGAMRWLWVVLHEQNSLVPAPGYVMFVVYPLVPWVGVIAAGYAFGEILTLGRERRRRILFGVGLTAVALFVALRWTNAYGDPLHWATQGRGAWYTFLSFLNTQKYPPSLLFLLMTLGPSIIALALFDSGREPGALARPFVVFGRVPLFYYLLHFPLMHLVAVVFSYVKYGRAEWLFMNWPPPGQPQLEPEGYGYNLLVVYAVWLGVVLALYPLCRWFAGVKSRRRDAWLSYL
ncbi:MAG TPA: heparan-alpha-glucosaminide N-acetyltransferase domain-containing protein [Pyrinomonadaceae bacterium]|nr:heparan-alpha-glucosaminide N-acetyltransferase domain-containing protein [Pyrinomonadaceae bacterium]